MKKRIIFSAILLVLVIGVLFGGIFLLRKNTTTKKPETKAKTVHVEKSKEEKMITKETEKEKKNQASMEFENMNLLESYFSTEEIESIEQQAESFLKQDETFDSIQKITCTEVYETENQIKFYFTLDDGTLLFATYKKEESQYFFWTQEKEYSESAIADWQKQKESQTKAVDTSSWEEEQKLPKAWEENGEENIPVTLSGKENLKGKIPDEDLNNLETEMQKFLDENNELRRELSIPVDKIAQEEDKVTFEADFKTERIDKKQLQVIYHVSEKKFGFILQ